LVHFVDGGQADCLFDFSGELRSPAQGKITIPQGSVEMHVPASKAARITVETFGAVDLGDGFSKKSGAFWNQAALAGQAPVLKIQVTVLMGTMRLYSC
jgi:hypothetical protein